MKVWREQNWASDGTQDLVKSLRIQRQGATWRKGSEVQPRRGRKKPSCGRVCRLSCAPRTGSGPGNTWKDG
ncbi:hypothetical protein GN956_G24976 [Arapaima gigas]